MSETIKPVPISVEVTTGQPDALRSGLTADSFLNRANVVPMESLAGTINVLADSPALRARPEDVIIRIGVINNRIAGLREDERGGEEHHRLIRELTQLLTAPGAVEHLLDPNTQKSASKKYY